MSMWNEPLTWQHVILAALNVMQVVALAYIAARWRDVTKNGGHK